MTSDDISLGLSVFAIILSVICIIINILSVRRANQLSDKMNNFSKLNEEYRLLDGLKKINLLESKWTFLRETTWRERWWESKTESRTFWVEINKLLVNFDKTKLSTDYHFLIIDLFSNDSNGTISFTLVRGNDRIDFKISYYDFDTFIKGCSKYLPHNVDPLNYLLDKALRKKP